MSGMPSYVDERPEPTAIFPRQRGNSLPCEKASTEGGRARRQATQTTPCAHLHPDSPEARPLPQFRVLQANELPFVLKLAGLEFVACCYNCSDSQSKHSS